MMAQIAISLEVIKSQFRTVFSTRSPTHHATPRCSQHPAHLAHPHLSIFHRCATKTTTTPHTRTTTPVFPLTMQIANKTTTMTPRSTSLSPRRPTFLILDKPTAPITEEDNPDVDVPTDDMDVATVEARHQAEDEITTLTPDGPEMARIWLRSHSHLKAQQLQKTSLYR